MYCKSCGKEIEDNSIFCKWCGESLSSKQEKQFTKEKKKISYNIARVLSFVFSIVAINFNIILLVLLIIFGNLEIVYHELVYWLTGMIYLFVNAQLTAWGLYIYKKNSIQDKLPKYLFYVSFICIFLLLIAWILTSVLM